MFTVLSTNQIIVVIIGTIAFYGLILAFVYGKRKLAVVNKPALSQTHATNTGSLIGPTVSPISSPSPAFQPSSFSQPVIEEQEPDEINDDIPEFDDELPFVEEHHTTLLKEAERVVEEIQSVVDNISTRPANPEEVFVKIQSIVSEYSFFFDTEYYDAINRFVAVTVQRDCDLQLSEEDLKALWYAAAA